MMQKKRRRSLPKRVWTQKEDNYMIKHYLIGKTPEEISIYLRRTHKAITARARALGLAWYPKSLDKNKLTTLNKKLDKRLKENEIKTWK